MMFINKYWLHLNIILLIIPMLLARWQYNDRNVYSTPVLQEIATELFQDGCPVVTLTQKHQQNYTLLETASWGVSVFKVDESQQEPNVTQTQSNLSHVISQIRKLREVSQCLTLVVGSDDLTFLTGFSYWSLHHNLFVWSTRLLVLTYLPLSHLQSLHKLLSSNNAMLILLKSDMSQIRMSVYLKLPYSAPEVHPIHVASWITQKGLKLTSHIKLFPDKFKKFSDAPNIVVAIELISHHIIKWIEDPKAPGGRRLSFTGALDNTVQYLAKGMNFTFRYVRSKTHTFGKQNPDGSWTGMMGLVLREEADFAPGPFTFSPARAEVVDYSPAIWIDHLKILSGRQQPEMDPWGFLFPLTLVVWMAVLISLMVMFLVIIVLSWISGINYKNRMWDNDALTLVRIFLQQEVAINGKNWWWERVVLGLWMLATLVLTKSYSGNLMSLLAVRHITYPFQTIRDVLNNPSVVMIWHKDTYFERYLRTVESGIFREVMELESENRLEFHKHSEFSKSLPNLVRPGSHVFFDVGLTVTNLVAEEFSYTGHCDYFISKNGYLSKPFAMITKKNNHLFHGMNDKALSVVESGLFEYWMKGAIPNSTSCANQPRKILITGSLSLSNVWGIFVVLGGGHAVAGIIFWVEHLVNNLTKS